MSVLIDLAEGRYVPDVLVRAGFVAWWRCA